MCVCTRWQVYYRKYLAVFIQVSKKCQYIKNISPACVYVCMGVHSLCLSFSLSLSLYVRVCTCVYILIWQTSCSTIQKNSGVSLKFCSLCFMYCTALFQQRAKCVTHDRDKQTGNFPLSKTNHSLLWGYPEENQSYAWQPFDRPRVEFHYWKKRKRSVLPFALSDSRVWQRDRWGKQRLRARAHSLARSCDLGHALWGGAQWHYSVKSVAYIPRVYAPPSLHCPSVHLRTVRRE